MNELSSYNHMQTLPDFWKHDLNHENRVQYINEYET